MISIQVSLIQVQSIPKKKFLLNRAPKWRFKSSLCFSPALALEQTKSIFRNIKLSPSITALLLVLFHNGSSYFCDQGPTSLLTSQSVSSFAQSCLTLRDSKDHSPSGLPIQHQLPEFTQTHVHWVSDAIQPSHPVVPFSLLQSFPASGSFPMSQFFISGGQSSGVSASTSILPINIQNWFPLGWTGWISLLSKGLSRVFNTTVQKHQFFSAQLSL